MSARTHLFFTALVGTLLLGRLYGRTQLSGFVTTGLLIAWLAHLFDVVLDIRACRHLKWMAIPMTAMAMIATSYYTDFSQSHWAWSDCFFMPIIMAVLVIMPVHRNAPGTDGNELPEV